MKTKKSFRVLSLILLMLFTFTVVGCSNNAEVTNDTGNTADVNTNKPEEQKKETIKMALSHTNSMESPWEKASQAFAKVLNEESNGRFNVETFPNGSLCQKNWKVMIEMTQSGSSQFGIESVTALASEIPELGAIQIPFLFQNEQHVMNFLDQNPKIWQKWLDQFEKKNIKVIGINLRPFRQLINNKVMVKTPEDIKGLKFRVPDNPTFVKIFELLGAKPVPLSWGEIYSAIQLGTIVGEDNAVGTVYDAKTHEVAKNMTLWNYIADASILFMNKELWDSLDKQEQELITKAAETWEITDYNENADYAKMARTEMDKANVQFYEMSAEEKEPFKELVQPLYDDFKNKLGEKDWNAFMEAIEAARP